MYACIQICGSSTKLNDIASETQANACLLNKSLTKKTTELTVVFFGFLAMSYYEECELACKGERDDA